MLVLPTNTPTLDPGSGVDGVAGLAQRRSLVRPVAVIVPCVLGQHLPRVPLAEDQHVIEATFPLDRIQDAYRRLAEGHVLGKIVLLP